MPTTNNSQRFATTKQQGIGFSKNSGAWVYPEAGTGCIRIIDSNDQMQMLVLDYKTGLFYNIAQRDGPVTTGLSTVWKDKVSTTGTGGTDIVSSIKFREDMGTFEHNFIKHLGSMFYFRPFKETLRNTTGYDSKGMPTGIGIDVSIYQDGEPTTPTSISDNISTVAETVFDRHAEGHRLQTEIVADKAPYSLVGRQQYYVSITKPEDPDHRSNTEGNNQLAIASPTRWLTRPDYTIDRITTTKQSFVSSIYNYMGPDSLVGSPILIYTQSPNYTFSIGSVTLLNNGAIYFWLANGIQDLYDIKIGSTSIKSAMTQVTTITTDGITWYLYQITNVGPYSGDLTITTTYNNILLFDFRVYSSALTTSQLAYYYKDIIQNNGNNVI